MGEGVNATAPSGSVFVVPVLDALEDALDAVGTTSGVFVAGGAPTPHPNTQDATSHAFRPISEAYTRYALSWPTHAA
jgi:hypothetical protein